MPRGDGTGPAGQGPMTGRRMGYCAGFSVPGFMNSWFGRGVGMGRGFGRGFGWRKGMMPIQPQVVPVQQIQPQVITEQQEREMLEQELKLIKQEMDEIQKRIKELK